MTTQPQKAESWEKEFDKEFAFLRAVYGENDTPMTETTKAFIRNVISRTAEAARKEEREKMGKRMSFVVANFSAAMASFFEGSPQKAQKFAEKAFEAAVLPPSPK